MEDQFSRTKLIFGDDAINRLKNIKVAIFGIGGVGGYVVEALVRSGIQNFTLIDNDKVNLSNINRQIIANINTVGKYKCDVMKERILSINPNCCVDVHKCFFLPSNEKEFDFTKFDYVVDAIDTVTAKIAIITNCIKNNIPVISSMGTGNKINPSMLMVDDIYNTKVDPLAKIMRKELKSRGVKKLKVVYSKERPILKCNIINEETKKLTPGSNSFVPASAGLLIASEVIKDLTGVRNDVLGA